MSEHTPGPWVLWENSPYFPRISSPDGWGVLSTHHLPEAEVRANARLIIAAPDMLAALKALHDSYIKACPMANVVAQQARAAIAKAESPATTTAKLGD